MRLERWGQQGGEGQLDALEAAEAEGALESLQQRHSRAVCL